MTIAVLAMFLAMGVPLTASRTDVEIGFSGGYTRWAPAWNNRKIVIYPPDLLKWVDRLGPRYPAMEYFSYGPDISVMFLHRWELSASFRYGEISTGGSGVALFPELNRRRLEHALKNYDLNGKLSLSLFEIMRIFAGLRSEIIDYTIDYSHIQVMPPAGFFRTTINGRSLHFTPEIGMGVAARLSPIFGIRASLACVFQSGSSKADYQDTYDLRGPVLGMQRIPTARYYAPGMSAALTLSATIPRIATTFSLGGYYRLLRYMQKPSRQGIYALDGSLDHLGGFFATVAYRFSFGEKKTREVWIPRPRYD